MGDVKNQSDSLDWIKSGGEAADDNGAAAESVAVSGDVVLSGRLGIAEAEAMHQQFTQILDAQVDITLTTEDLSRVDAAGVQLLYALVKEAKARSIALCWASVSDGLLEAATALGLQDQMNFAEAKA